MIEQQERRIQELFCENLASNEQLEKLKQKLH